MRDQDSYTATLTAFTTNPPCHEVGYRITVHYDGAQDITPNGMRINRDDLGVTQYMTQKYMRMRLAFYMFLAIAAGAIAYPVTGQSAWLALIIVPAFILIAGCFFSSRHDSKAHAKAVNQALLEAATRITQRLHPEYTRGQAELHVVQEVLGLPVNNTSVPPPGGQMPYTPSAPPALMPPPENPYSVPVVQQQQLQGSRGEGQTEGEQVEGRSSLSLGYSGPAG